MSEPTVARFPPPVTDISRPFWTGGAQHQLLISWCEPCGRFAHPPRAMCQDCGRPLVPRTVSGRGTVFTFTVNRHPFSPAVPVPYVIAVVELAEQDGLRFTTNIVGCDPDAVRIGMPVQVDFEPAGQAWAPVFRPAGPTRVPGPAAPGPAAPGPAATGAP